MRIIILWLAAQLAGGGARRRGTILSTASLSS